MMKKNQEEKIIFEEGLSFISSSLSLKNYFFWHYHPELELVYREVPHSIRNVGKHISNFTESDLILIGPNIPHLNFDYGIKTNYYQAVIQMKTSLVDVLMNTPIRALLFRSFF